MVGRAYGAPVHLERLEVATCKYVVDTEIEIAVVESDHRAEAYARIDALEAGVGECAYGVAARHIVEVAADYHVGAAVEPEPLQQLVGLAHTVGGGDNELVEHEDAPRVVLGGPAETSAGEAVGLQMHVEERQSAPGRQYHAVGRDVAVVERPLCHVKMDRLYGVFRHYRLRTRGTAETYMRIAAFQAVGEDALLAHGIGCYQTAALLQHHYIGILAEYVLGY